MEKIEAFQGEYRWLSNFWACSVEMEDGITYPSSEAAYMAQKTNVIEERQAISMMLPGQAKRHARKLVLRGGWAEAKVGVMLEVVSCKFLQNRDLAAKLLATGDAELIEGNTWGDRFWGVCDGEGENNLGKILMIVRDVLRKREEAAKPRERRRMGPKPKDWKYTDRKRAANFRWGMATFMKHLERDGFSPEEIKLADGAIAILSTLLSKERT